MARSAEILKIAFSSLDDERIRQAAVQNCKEAAAFVVPMLDHPEWRGTEKDFTSGLVKTPYPYMELIDLLQAAMPDPFLTLSRGFIVDWVDGITDGAPSSMVDSIVKGCQLDVCNGLQWEGNPDVAGVGVRNRPP